MRDAEFLGGGRGYRKREARSESVVSEALLKGALRQDVLAMPIDLAGRSRTSAQSRWRLLRFPTQRYCPLLPELLY